MIQHTDLEIVLDGSELFIFSELFINTKQEIALDGSERFRTISYARTIQNDLELSRTKWFYSNEIALNRSASRYFGGDARSDLPPHFACELEEHP